MPSVTVKLESSKTLKDAKVDNGIVRIPVRFRSEGFLCDRPNTLLQLERTVEKISSYLSTFESVDLQPSNVINVGCVVGLFTLLKKYVPNVIPTYHTIKGN